MRILVGFEEAEAKRGHEQGLDKPQRTKQLLFLSKPRSSSQSKGFFESLEVQVVLIFHIVDNGVLSSICLMRSHPASSHQTNLTTKDAQHTAPNTQHRNQRYVLVASSLLKPT